MEAVRETQKITNAMYLISSAKLRKAKKDLEDTQPYFNGIKGEIKRLFRMIKNVESRYFYPEDENKKLDGTYGYLLITADKGLAGAYNHNVLKIAEEELAKHDHTRLYVVGQVGRHYFARKNVHIDKHFQYTAQNPSMHRARVIADTMLEAYENGKLDEVYIIYTKMVNSVTAETDMIQLLPFKREDFSFSTGGVYSEEIKMEPSPEVVLDRIVPNYITGFIYGALVESFCSEQNSRMMAMDTATNSAKEMLQDLNIKYNRARQAAITQEITEVVGGARAQQNRK